MLTAARTLLRKPQGPEAPPAGVISAPVFGRNWGVCAQFSPWPTFSDLTATPKDRAAARQDLVPVFLGEVAVSATWAPGSVRPLGKLVFHVCCWSRKWCGKNTLGKSKVNTHSLRLLWAAP